MARQTQSTSSTSTPSKSQKPESSQANNLLRGPAREEIARRAYELYLARGGVHGYEQEDWFQAERELKLGRY
ncbi:MAG: DUF2934 domain-containing protein [Myxococcaceae bacterium]